MCACLYACRGMRCACAIVFMYPSMYVMMYVRMHVCMYVCTACLYACMGEAMSCNVMQGNANVCMQCQACMCAFCLSVCLSVCHVCLSGCLFVCPSVRLSVHPSACLSVCLSFCLFVCLSVCLSVCLPVLCVCPVACAFMFAMRVFNICMFKYATKFVLEALREFSSVPVTMFAQAHCCQVITVLNKRSASTCMVKEARAMTASG